MAPGKRLVPPSAEELEAAAVSANLPAVIGSGATYKSAHLSATVGNVSSDPRKGRRRPAELDYFRKVDSINSRLNLTGVQAVAVINLLPIPLVVNSTMSSIARIRIPAAQDGGFTYHVFEEVDIQPRYDGEGVSSPVEFVPAQQAYAFVKEYEAFGGVVDIRADKEMMERAGKTILDNELVKDSKKHMLVWAQRKVTDAWNYYNTPDHRESISIVQVHRACATLLKSNGMLPKDPPWMEVTRDYDNAVPKCGLCQREPLRGACICECGQVLDPIAYFTQTGDEAHICYERLTRQQVEDLGISKYVAETVDERPKRLAKGLPKPLSEAQKIAIAVEEQVFRQQETVNATRATKAAAPPSALDQI